jgi:hypothetical protein
MEHQKHLQIKTVELYKRNFHIKYTLVIFTKGPVINADHKELSQNSETAYFETYIIRVFVECMNGEI